MEPVSDDYLTYLVPVYSITLKPGENIPGTQLYFVAQDGSRYNVTIDGLAAVKQAGDSFNWIGVTAPGVIGRFNLRLSPTLRGGDLLAAGPVELSVLNPIAVELDGVTAPNNIRYTFDNIAVQYLVPIGDRIPGTTLVYEGRTDQGAELSGTNRYPFLSRGDSLLWTGRLRGNVVVRYNLRVATLGDDSIRLLGTADLWITQ
jgi:hypothetical protein